MKLFKSKLLILKNLPDELYDLIFKKLLFSFVISIFVILVALYSKSLVFIICAVVIVLTRFASIAYEYYLISKDKILFVRGICTDIEKKFIISNKNSYNHLIIKTDDYIYKCNIPQNNVKQFKTGQSVSVYATERNIYKDTSGFIIISYPLYVIPCSH